MQEEEFAIEINSFLEKINSIQNNFCMNVFAENRLKNGNWVSQNNRDVFGARVLWTFEITSRFSNIFEESKLSEILSANKFPL